MIPILYDSNETAFVSNGLGRLRDCVSCIVTEERNGIYECEFEYPVDGAHFSELEAGRIIAVMHDDTGDVQPFDIVGHTKPVNGVATFHAVHISYRLNKSVVTGSGINSLSDAFVLLGQATPAQGFTYWTDKTSTGYLGGAAGIPVSVRSLLGGIEGSVLDAYGGEYEWDRWTVKLWASRGTKRDFTVRYGVNLTEYNDEVDTQESYTSVKPYWYSEDVGAVIGDVVHSGQYIVPGRVECVPLDLTDKFENKPTKAQVEAAAASYLSSNRPYLPSRNIEISFVRLSDTPEYKDWEPLQRFRLCDTITVEFPMYNLHGQFKIVSVVYDVLQERYQTVQLGSLQTTLAEALGVSESSPAGKQAVVVEPYNLGTFSFTAGTPGTTGVMLTQSVSKPGYKPVSVTPVYVNTSVVGFNCFFSADLSTVYTQVIRRQQGAFTSTYDVSISVVYVAD